MEVQRLVIIWTILIFFALFSTPDVKASEKTEVLLRCEQLFGKPVNKDPILFEVNRFYVVHPDFEGDKLKVLGAQPKYFFEEIFADGKETKDFTHLSLSEYEGLLSQLDSIKPTGKLVKKAAIGMVTNMTAWFTDSYENALVTRGVVTDLRRGENAPVEIRWIAIKYEEKAAR